MNVDKLHQQSSLSTPVSRPARRLSLAGGDNAPQEKDVVTLSASEIKGESDQSLVPLIISGLSKADKKKVEKLLQEKFKGQVGSELPLVNGFSGKIDKDSISAFIKLLPESANIRADNEITVPDPLSLMPIPDIKGPEDENKPAEGNVNIETLGINRVWEKGYTGRGVGVCVIDSGMISHEDFADRITGWHDMSSEHRPDNYDPFGHGTHDMGIVGGSGKALDKKVQGVAPDCNLIGIRITCVSEAIQALQYAVENKERLHIDIINMSLGDYSIKSYKNDPWALAAEKACDAGIIVCVAAGNEGPSGRTVSTPGIDPRVITVGAFDDKKTADTKDDRIADFSSRGPTIVDDIVKPDLVAPGVNIFGPLAEGATLDVGALPHLDNKYIAMSGTSAATPMVAGICALLKSADPTLDHDAMKKILRETAVRMPDLDTNSQGAGRVDAAAALERVLKEKAAREAGTLSDPTAPAVSTIASEARSVETASGAKATLKSLNPAHWVDSHVVRSADLKVPDDEWLIP